MNDRQERFQLRLATAFFLLIAGRFFMAEDLLQGSEVDVELPASRPLAQFSCQDHATDFGPKLHVSVHSSHPP